jgi:hypothetical protein
LLTPQQRALTAASSAKRGTQSRKSLEDGAGFLRDLEQTLFGAYDGVRT